MLNEMFHNIGALRCIKVCQVVLELGQKKPDKSIFQYFYALFEYLYQFLHYLDQERKMLYLQSYEFSSTLF